MNKAKKRTSSLYIGSRDKAFFSVIEYPQYYTHMEINGDKPNEKKQNLFIHTFLYQNSQKALIVF